MLVPWDRVFIDGDVQIYNSMRETGYAINMTTQSTIRALTKLEFAYGLATRMAELIGDTSPATTEMLGELACYVRLSANALELSLEQAWERADGVWFPNGAALEPMRSMLAMWMPRVAEIITLIGSHNLLTTPSRAELDDPALRPLIDEMLHGADGATADERAAVFRMAWDLVGSALGGRGFLYERPRPPRRRRRSAPRLTSAAPASVRDCAGRAEVRSRRWPPSRSISSAARSRTRMRRRSASGCSPTATGRDETGAKSRC